MSVVHGAPDFGDCRTADALTTNGVTRKACGSLKPDYLLNDVSMESDNGSLGGSTITTPEIRMNTPPVPEVVGDSVRTAKVGETNHALRARHGRRIAAVAVSRQG